MDKNKKTEEPGLHTKAWSLTKSLTRYAMSGFPNVAEKIYEQRMLICHGCEKLNKEKASCMVCGCKVEYKGRMETESCPQKKW